MAVVRILISRELSADERAALADYFGRSRIGSTDATRWAEGELNGALASIVADYLRELEEHQKRERETGG